MTAEFPFPTKASRTFALLFFGAAMHALAAPSVEQIEKYHIDEGREAARWLLKQELDDPEAVMRALFEKRKDRMNYSLLQDGMKLCRDAARFAHATQDTRAAQAAAALADALLRKHVTPSGAFVEYDRNTWLAPEIMWRTIPWGTAFCGNRAFEAWREIKADLMPEQRAFWRQSLEKTGAWIHKNPVIGGYVFNMSVDLCGLLWRIGDEFKRPEWCEWALFATNELIRRDVDEEGWIKGENGGVSGAYQLIGANYLARFAWESKASSLREAVSRIFARSALPYATPTLEWTGNFGTRVSDLRRLPGPLVLAAAAFGDAHAAYCVQTYGVPGWDDDLALWRAALAQAPQAPVYAPIARFKGIESTVVREGPWVAYFGNYKRSIWAHGFASLWHEDRNDWVFSTLNSLNLLSTTEKAKTRVSDISDWAGFPHVRVTNGPAQYDSHRHIDIINTSRGEDGVTVKWSEPLLDGESQSGGTLNSTYRFHGQDIEMNLDLREVAGEARLDFHFMRRPNGFIRLWFGNDVADALAGRLLKSPGIFEDRTFKPGETKLFGVQADRTFFAFELVEIPARAVVAFVGQSDSGLHTSNLGGFRFRITLPAAEKNHLVKLRLRAVP